MKSLQILLDPNQAPATKLFMFHELYKLEIQEDKSLPELYNITGAFEIYEDSDMEQVEQGKRIRISTITPAGSPAILFSFIIRRMGGYLCYTDVEYGEEFYLETLEEVEIALILWQAIQKGLLTESQWPYWVDHRNNPDFVNVLCES